MGQAKKRAEESGRRLKVFFQDEARFGRISDPRACWAPQRCRPSVGSQIVREYTYVYGAICPFDGAACYLILPAMTSICMNIFLAEVSKRYPDDFIFMVYDGAPCHSEGALTIPDNMMLMTLPPYSPNLNPVENNWDDMREKFFLNTVYDSMDEVEDTLITACLFYEANPEIIHSLASWKWIVSCQA